MKIGRAEDRTDTAAFPGRLLADRSHAGLFLDFDGTLAPIVSDPASARLAPGARDALERVARSFAVVAVVSGRAIDDLAARVDVPGVWLSGGHGRVIRAPDGWTRVVEIAPDVADRLAKAEAAIGPLAPAIRIERKPASIAFHYRGYEDDARLVADLTERARSAADRFGLVAAPGRCVVEVRLPGVDKGMVVRAIVERCGLGAVGVVGDDWTDLDAFRAARALRGQAALTVAVQGVETPDPLLAEANLVLDDVAAVVEWLERLRPVV